MLTDVVIAKTDFQGILLNEIVDAIVITKFQFQIDAAFSTFSYHLNSGVPFAPGSEIQFALTSATANMVPIR